MFIGSYTFIYYPYITTRLIYRAQILAVTQLIPSFRVEIIALIKR